MQATRIIAVRHGETAWNVDTRIQGHLDIPLNTTGVLQAGLVAQALADEPVDAVYASDLLRAWQTACAIAHACCCAATPERQLRERAFGSFEGKTFAELEQTWPEDSLRWRKRDPDWEPPGGESLISLRQRIGAVVTQLASRHLGGQIVLVAHGGVMDVLYRLATGQPLQAPRTWLLGNTAINRLLWTPERLTLVGWGDTRHLDDLARDETSA
ncbi:MAG: histidine phosphatase family protein [Rhodoferax sp.]|nr:histidine phosphatase family protein [Rhodoferax sp.]